MTTAAFTLSRRPMRVPAARRGAATRATAHETRSFLGAAAAIALAFALALVYLSGTTGVASAGYESQRLQAARDELRRQNTLLELELARLDAPARIEAEAKRLGLVRVSFIPVLPADPLTARK